MWPQEIKRAIAQLEVHLAPRARTALDVGSEGEVYRTVRQPWNQSFYDYLANRQMHIHTMDLEAGTQPDFVRDITQPLIGVGAYHLVIATHLLEHIPSECLPQVVRNLELLTSEDGLLLVSVPRKYPYHPRPIDTMYRPTWEELRPMFGGRLVYGETFEVDHTSPEYMNNPKCQVSQILLRY